MKRFKRLILRQSFFTSCFRQIYSICRRSILQFLSLFSVIFIVYNASGALDISMAQIPTPADSLVEQWTDQFYDIQEFWIIKSITGLRIYLIEQNFSEDQIQEILSKVQKNFTSNQMGRLISNLSLGDSQGVIFVDKNLKNSLSHEQLNLVYQYLLKNNKLIHFQSFAHQQELQQFLSKYHLNASEMNVMQKMLFSWDGKIYLIFTPEFWPLLNRQLRKEYVLKNLKDSPNRYGHQILIHLNQEKNLTKLAEKYAMGRNPAYLERYLYYLKNLGIQQIPLEKILTPFIRQFVNQYSICHGPNCMNSAKNVGKTKKMISIQTTDTDEFLSNMHEGYEMVFSENDHELRPGDVLVYSDLNKGVDIDHAAVYIGDGIVFTKNGVSRYNPYIFQLKSKMEENLNYSDAQSLIVYRPIATLWHPSCRYVFQ